MKQIKLDRICTGLNKWLSEHKFNARITIVKHEGFYKTNLWMHNAPRIIKSGIVNDLHFNARHEEYLREFIFNHIQTDFNEAIK